MHKNLKHMSRLDDLYRAMETLQKEEVSTEDLEQKVYCVEESIIKEAVLPVLNDVVAPRLAPIRNEFVLMLEYHHGAPISVALSRKAIVSDIPEVKILHPVPVENKVDIVDDAEKPTEPNKDQPRRVTKKLRVKYNGKVIYNDNARETFRQAIKCIGPARICETGILSFGTPLVSRTINEDRYPQHHHFLGEGSGEGFYVMTHGNINDLANRLREVSERLNLGLVVETTNREGEWVCRNERYAL